MTTNKPQCEIGVFGLGVMGSNLLLNMADHGFTVAGYNRDISKLKNITEGPTKDNIHITSDIKAFVELHRLPRAIMLLVPAGPVVDSVIEDLLPYLEPGDLIIDAGNSYYKDTDVRTNKLKDKGIQFLGIGVSGGEYGARHGPSIMPGGSKTAYDRVHKVLEAIAANVKGEPCVTYLGAGSSGHYVKMVHNGVEYAIMQLISESYDLMKRGAGVNNDQLHKIYSEWNKGELNSYLIEITADIFAKEDDTGHNKLIDKIKGVAEQNGTGMWTARSAMELQVPVPTLDVGVNMRDISVLEKERLAASAIYQRPIKQLNHNQEEFIQALQNALFSATIIAYAQGLALLRKASIEYKYNLSLEDISRIWRGGCIIRAALLDDICTAYRTKIDLENLLLAPNLAPKINEYQNNLRSIVSQAAQLGIPAPGLMSALGYLDTYRSEWLPANLIQAQRDYFGSHQYERLDKKGSFHTEWGQK